MPETPGPTAAATTTTTTTTGTAPPAGDGELIGLTTAEAERRRAAGQGNDVADPTSRTYAQIVRANVFTRFNALLGVLLAAILAVGEYRDALFGIVLVLNAVIGIVQEARAKRTLDRLTVLSAPRARVRRDGDVVDVPVGELVFGDVVELAPGDQVSVDGTVLASSGLEIDESLLTGEADPVHKGAGTEVLSGSFVAAGHGVARADRVGAESYAARIRADASRFTLVRSELRAGVDRILRIVTWILVPTAIALVTAQYRYQQADNATASLRERVTEGVQASVAGLVAMVPEGLVLLTSLAFALGVIRLGRKQVLTQELAAIEGLARVDVICLDKTGTLTEGNLELDEVEPLADAGGRSPGLDELGDVLAALVAGEPNPNPSLRAVAERYADDPGWPLAGCVPFSSARKWSAAAFSGHGTYVLGAPEILLAAIAGGASDLALGDGAGDAGDPTDPHAAAAARVHHCAATGRRVLLLARTTEGLSDTDDPRLPAGLEPHALVVLEERIRPDAPDTIRYFLRQGVQVKVISGDNPVTVGAVADRVGVPGADRPYDARRLPPVDDVAAMAEVLEAHSVFGRVTPQQKRAMVHALQSRNHEVAMTGDGVNDTLALKDADIGVAMGSGSAAARSVARFVLLDNSFAVFPSVVAEGRRVIANVERVANLFLTKTFYALVLAIAVGISGLAYPFVPRHLTLISGLTIGIPAFFLALAPNARRARPGFLDRVLRVAVPAGAVAGMATLAAYLLVRDLPGVDLAHTRTVTTITLYTIATWVLVILARPLVPWRIGLIGSMIGLFLLVLVVPRATDYFDLHLPAASVVGRGLAVAAVACVVLEIGWRTFARAAVGEAAPSEPADGP